MTDKMMWRAYRLSGGEKAMIEVSQLNRNGHSRKVMKDVSLKIEPGDFRDTLERAAADLTWLLTL